METEKESFIPKTKEGWKKELASLIKIVGGCIIIFSIIGIVLLELNKQGVIR